MLDDADKRAHWLVRKYKKSLDQTRSVLRSILEYSLPKSNTQSSFYKCKHARNGSLGTIKTEEAYELGNSILNASLRDVLEIPRLSPPKPHPRATDFIAKLAKKRQIEGNQSAGDIFTKELRRGGHVRHVSELEYSTEKKSVSPPRNQESLHQSIRKHQLDFAEKTAKKSGHYRYNSDILTKTAQENDVIPEAQRQADIIIRDVVETDDIHHK
jgi:hypothetical protein